MVPLWSVIRVRSQAVAPLQRILRQQSTFATPVQHRVSDQSRAERLKQDALRTAKPSRMSQLIMAAKHWDSMRIVMTQQLLKELRIRFAHQILRLKHQLPPCKAVHTLLVLHTDIYDQLWELEGPVGLLSHKHGDPSVLLRHFTALASEIEGRCSTIVETLMEGLKEVVARESQVEDPSRIIPKVEVDRFLQARIGISLLVHHYIELSKGNRSTSIVEQGLPSGTQLPEVRWGAVTENAVLREMVEDACAEVDQISEHYYAEKLPTVEVQEEGGTDIAATIVPAHLHHTLFEILKNAYRATVESALRRNLNTLPPIEISIFEGMDEHCIRIRDHGDGMNLRTLQTATRYLWTTSRAHEKQKELQQSYQPVTEPLHGMGLGLPVSQLYARHFSGDIRIISVQGHGTDVALYLSIEDPPERIPIRCFQ